MEREHLSHSAAEEYIKCPQRFYLNRILQVESTQWLAGPAGSAFHTMTEDYDNDEPVRTFQEYLDDNLEEGVLYTHSRGEDYDWWVNTGPTFFDNYKEWRRATGWEILAVEEEFRIQPAGLQWPVVGFIDRRFRSQRTGTEIICDIKSGYRLPVNSVQLPIYFVADQIRRIDGLGKGSVGSDQEIAVNYYDVRRGNSTGLEWPTWTEADLIRHFQPVEHGILTEDWTAKPGSQCRYCPVRKHCQFKKGK